MPTPLNLTFVNNSNVVDDQVYLYIQAKPANCDMTYQNGTQSVSFSGPIYCRTRSL